jgi:hypothetical protein
MNVPSELLRKNRGASASTRAAHFSAACQWIHQELAMFPASIGGRDIV